MVAVHGQQECSAYIFTFMKRRKLLANYVNAVLELNKPGDERFPPPLGMDLRAHQAQLSRNTYQD
jgi:hypothetical protein